jgi:hypothetical protein
MISMHYGLDRCSLNLLLHIVKIREIPHSPDAGIYLVSSGCDKRQLNALDAYRTQSFGKDKSTLQGTSSCVIYTYNVAGSDRDSCCRRCCTWKK